MSFLCKIFLFFSISACNVENLKNSNTASAKEEVSNTSIEINSTISTDTQLNNLINSLNEDYIQTAKKSLSDLSLLTGEERCPVGETPLIINKNMTKEEMSRVQSTIQERIKNCILKYGNQLNLNEFNDIEQQLNLSWGKNHVGYCNKDNDCGLMFEATLCRKGEYKASSRLTQGTLANDFNYISRMILGYVEMLNEEVSKKNGEINKLDIECPASSIKNPKARCFKNTCRSEASF